VSAVVDWIRDPLVQGFLHASLAALFARSAWHKLRDLHAFRRALAGYGLLPVGLEAAAARSLAIVESGVALALLAPGMGGAPAWCGAALLGLYTGAMAMAWHAGRRDVDCGCGAPGAGQPIGPGLWLRNALLMAALCAAAPGALPRPSGALDVAQVGLAAIAAALFYAAVEQARSNAHRLGAAAATLSGSEGTAS
jgi:hypothetical protein